MQLFFLITLLQKDTVLCILLLMTYSSMILPLHLSAQYFINTTRFYHILITTIIFYYDSIFITYRWFFFQHQQWLLRPFHLHSKMTLVMQVVPIELFIFHLATCCLGLIFPSSIKVGIYSWFYLLDAPSVLQLLIFFLSTYSL